MLVEMEDGVEEREEEQVQVVVEEKGEASVHWRLAHSSGESHQQSMCMSCCVLHQRSRLAQDRRVAWEFSAGGITVESISGWRQIATVLGDMLCATLMLACWQHA
jgi:hypothetical protein